MSAAEQHVALEESHLSGDVLVDGEKPAGSIGDLDKLRRLASRDSTAYYAPGWEAAGLSVDPRLDRRYRPQLDDRNRSLASGAVDLTATGWPGTSVYRPWRGAVKP
jgi:hypothetical protein